MLQKFRRIPKIIFTSSTKDGYVRSGLERLFSIDFFSRMVRLGQVERGYFELEWLGLIERGYFQNISK